jgi:hypothetical protein
MDRQGEHFQYIMGMDNVTQQLLLPHGWFYKL